MIIHVLRVPTVVLTSKPLGERWCFVCRKRVEFWHDIITITHRAKGCPAYVDLSVMPRRRTAA